MQTAEFGARITNIGINLNMRANVMNCFLMDKFSEKVNHALSFVVYKIQLGSRVKLRVTIFSLFIILFFTCVGLYNVYICIIDFLVYSLLWFVEEINDFL